MNNEEFSVTVQKTHIYTKKNPEINLDVLL